MFDSNDQRYLVRKTGFVPSQDYVQFHQFGKNALKGRDQVIMRARTSNNNGYVAHKFMGVRKR